MSMFMASMRNAAKNGELDGMGMFGAALKRDVAEYEQRLAEEAACRQPPSAPTQPNAEEGDHVS